MSSFSLRITALACMIIDHAGLALFPDISLFRCIGRISFPLYCYLIVQGYRHTRDPAAYGRRLALLAILSEIPFDLLIFARQASPVEQNVLFSLLLSLIALSITDTWHTKPIHAGAAFLFLCLCAMAARVSYGWLGIVLCLCMHHMQANKTHLALGVSAALLLYTLSLLLSGVTRSWVLISLCSLASLLPILLYNGKHGLRHPALIFLFYAAYPLHLLLLVLMRTLRIVPPYFF